MCYGFVMRAADLVYIARSRAGLTQAQLGERVGVAQNAIARIENGHVEPSFALVMRIFKAAGCQPHIELGTQDASWRADVRRRLALTPSERVAAATEASAVFSRLRGIAASQGVR